MNDDELIKNIEKFENEDKITMIVYLLILNNKRIKNIMSSIIITEMIMLTILIINLLK
nr:MAG TPA: hypothetical protein [Caudoviricetes sp.]